MDPGFRDGKEALFEDLEKLLIVTSDGNPSMTSRHFD